MKNNARVSTLVPALVALPFLILNAGCTAKHPPAQAKSKADASHLGYTKKLVGVTDIDTALTKVKTALKAQGFGVITQINVQAVMKKKLGVDGKPYWILGACNPKLAHKAITADAFLGLLLPCKVIVFQAPDGSFLVSFAKPKKMFTLAKTPQLADLANQVDAKIKAAHDSL
ncbi:MAG: DUF302 domain-containing protein [bacterium]